MKYEFSYNGKTIAYEIINKKVKNINIRVKPSGEVVVSCNESVDNKTIELEMIKRANWLLDTIDKYKTNFPKCRQVPHCLHIVIRVLLYAYGLRNPKSRQVLS